MTSDLQFEQITLSGDDAEKFLQGQVTCDVAKLDVGYTPCAIANLKGRIAFGLWLKKLNEKQFELVTVSDCMDDLQAHLKKYGAFSRFEMNLPTPVYPCVIEDDPTFSVDDAHLDAHAWQQASIAQGNYWIVAATQGQFQPQELRLHQRGGVDYDKGCYLGQEVIARIYFKSAPKSFLHRIKGSGELPEAGSSLQEGKIQVVNAVSVASESNHHAFEALVVARPEQLQQSKLTLLDLPVALQRSVARDS